MSWTYVIIQIGASVNVQKDSPIMSKTAIPPGRYHSKNSEMIEAHSVVI